MSYLNRNDVKYCKNQLFELLNTNKDLLDVLYNYNNGHDLFMKINNVNYVSSKNDGFEYDWQHSTNIYLKEFKTHYEKIFNENKITSYRLSEIYFTLLQYVYFSYNTYKTSKKMLNFYKQIISLCKDMYFCVY